MRPMGLIGLMRIIRHIGLVVVLVVSWQAASAQTMEERYRSFQRSAKKTYADFRDEANARYAKFLNEAWQPCSPDSTVSEPQRQLDPPVYREETDTVREPEVIQYELNTAATAEYVQPQPIAPVKENRQPSETIDIVFYGTTLTFRAPKLAEVKLKRLSDKQYAAAWQTLAGEEFDNLLFDCLAARDKYQLCDYAYIQMLEALSEKIYGKTNEAVFLKAFLYAQSGYSMKLANSLGDNRLYMLFGSKYTLYNRQMYTLEGMHYYLTEDAPEDLCISRASFSNEQPLSLQINYDLRLAGDSMKAVSRTSGMGIRSSLEVNEHLIDFYQNYPTGNIEGELSTLYAVYANAPLEKDIRQTLYPALKKAIKGYSERDAVNKLLNFVQTAFEYKVDDEVWGQDRIFFPLETLYYPYSDCEDRSILFSRLVRDLTGNDVVLVLYPNHLATAVRFNSDVKGDYLMLDNEKYVICDPTYINSSAGEAMPRYRGVTAQIIKLQ